MYLVLIALQRSYGETHEPYGQTHAPYGEAHTSPKQVSPCNNMITKPLIDFNRTWTTFLYGMVYGLDTLNQRQHCHADASQVWLVWRVLANKKITYPRA
jgi:hypothetical protein